MISITPIPAFNDNYFWLLSNQNNAVIVDPGDSEVVIQYLQAHQLDLKGILVTHHHSDHIGGVLKLKNQYQCEVWGPSDPRIKQIDHYCGENDWVEISVLNLLFKTLSVPGHTSSHIAYFLAAEKNQLESQQNALFCGDTLFSAGCGRLFEGSPEQMYHSLNKIKNLPEDTLIYPAHEYTLANINFALTLEPNNQTLVDYKAMVTDLRKNQQPSLPSNLKQEININPFLRCNQLEIVQSVQNYLKKPPVSEEEVFATVRLLKDQF